MFPIHTFSGTPYIIGYQHGVALANSIHALWALYKPLFGDDTPALWDRVAQYSDYIQQNVPTLYIEMEGIAAGSSLPLAYIIALNARSELIQSDIVNKDEKMNECTTIYSAKTHTLAQTWDFQNTIGDHVFIGIIHQDEGLTITQLMEPGIV
jgi:hypothetical protein